jgi:filamentous hemagglutinin
MIWNEHGHPSFVETTISPNNVKEVGEGRKGVPKATREKIKGIFDDEHLDAGHLIPDRLGGSSELDNLIPEYRGKNRGEIRDFEAFIWEQVAVHGKVVRLKVTPVYGSQGRIPTKILYEYTIDGKTLTKTIDNTP